MSSFGDVLKRIGSGVGQVAPIALPLAGSVGGLFLGGPTGAAFGGSLGGLAGGALGQLGGNSPAAPSGSGFGGGSSSLDALRSAFAGAEARAADPVYFDATAQPDRPAPAAAADNTGLLLVGAVLLVVVLVKRKR